MKNPFRFFQSKHAPGETAPQPVPAPTVEPAAEPPQPEPEVPDPPDDGFTEWCRSQTRGGIERRERNDIYEAYSVYGADRQGALVCRYYHRYPEHEREFDLSSERVLSFHDFNKRLLAELDKGDLTLAAYNTCIEKAEQLNHTIASPTPAHEGFSEEETAALRDFCEGLDALTDKEYRGGSGIFRCACRSVVGDDTLNLWFRKPLPHDALNDEVAGVSRTVIGGYDIENLWMMGVYNRFAALCGRCTVTLLTSLWSLEHETVCLLQAEHFPGIDGTVLLAVSDAASFPRFGFYSLDFANK